MGCILCNFKKHFKKSKEIQLISLRQIPCQADRCEFCGIKTNNPVYMSSIDKKFCGITCWEVWHRKNQRILKKQMLKKNI